MPQSWQLRDSLLGQNSIHNCIFSTTMLCKQLRRLHRSEQAHSITPTAARDQVAKHSPRAVSSSTEDWKHDTRICSSTVSPLHLRGLLGGHPISQPSLPLPSIPAGQGGAAAGMWGDCDFLERLRGPAGGSKPY